MRFTWTSLFYLFMKTWKGPWRAGRDLNQAFFSIAWKPTCYGDITCDEMIAIDYLHLHYEWKTKHAGGRHHHPGGNHLKEEPWKNLVKETLQLEKMWLIERVNIDFTCHLCYSGDCASTWSKKGRDVPSVQRRAAICEKVYSLWKNHLNGNIKLPASYFASFRIWYCHSLQ